MVHLVPLTKANWKAVAALTVADDQADFVPSNLYSIAEAQFYPDAQPLAVHADENTLVGFVLYGRDDATGHWKLFRLMIDRAFQRRGYGTAALEAVIARIREHPDAHDIRVCYHTANTTAQRLYTRAGFRALVTVDGVVTASLGES